MCAVAVSGVWIKKNNSGVPLPIRVTVKPDRTYDMEICTPTSMWLLMHAAGIRRGATYPCKYIAEYLSGGPYSVQKVHILYKTHCCISLKCSRVQFLPFPIFPYQVLLFFADASAKPPDAHLSLVHTVIFYNGVNQMIKIK